MFRIQSDDYIMYEFYCITFMEYMIAGKALLDNNNIFYIFSVDYQENC